MPIPVLLENGLDLSETPKDIKEKNLNFSSPTELLKKQEELYKNEEKTNDKLKSLQKTEILSKEPIKINKPLIEEIPDKIEENAIDKPSYELLEKYINSIYLIFFIIFN